MKRTKRYRADHPKVKRWAMVTVRRIRHRAARLNIPFNLDAPFLIERWTGKCPSLGVTLTFNSKSTPSSPSVDRLIPSLGYTKGNVEILSMRANTLKGDATPRELQAVADWLQKHWRR